MSSKEGNRRLWKLVLIIYFMGAICASVAIIAVYRDSFYSIKERIASETLEDELDLYDVINYQVKYKDEMERNKAITKDFIERKEKYSKSIFLFSSQFRESIGFTAGLLLGVPLAIKGIRAISLWIYKGYKE